MIEEETVAPAAAEAVERRSLKLRARLLVRAKLVRALEEVKVRSVVVLVKLRSRSESGGGNKNVGSSIGDLMYGFVYEIVIYYFGVWFWFLVFYI